MPINSVTTNKSKLYPVITFLLVGVFITVGFFVLKKVDVFGDGSLHLSITNYINQYKEWPTQDFNGQINVNLRQPESFQIPNIYSPPIYFLLSGVSQTLGLSSVNSLDIVSIFSVVFSGFLLFYITKKYISGKAAPFTPLLFFLASGRYWNLSHRLLENYIILISLTGLYTLLLLIKSQRSYVAFGFFLSFLFFSKQSNLFFCVYLCLLGIVLFGISKKLIRSIIIAAILFVPGFMRMINIRGTIIPVPPPIGQKSMDDILFSNQWRKNQVQQERETKLDQKVNIKQIRTLTFYQFQNFVQDSLDKSIKQKELHKLVQKYFPLNTTATFVQGYNALGEKGGYKVNILLLCLCLLFVLKNPKETKKIVYISLLLGVVVTLFYTKFVMFRYYIIISIINIALFSLGIGYISKEYKKTTIIFIFLFIVGQSPFLVTEAFRNIKYQHSINHNYTNNSGGLAEIQVLKQIPNYQKQIFLTPIMEIPYYISTKIYRDEKFFFLDTEEDLLYYLHKAGIRYIVNPFYSNIVPRSRRKYFNGIPSDSVLGKMLHQQNCFNLIYDQLAFDVYELQDHCLTNQGGKKY